MANKPKRSRGRATPILRHHLEDASDSKHRRQEDRNRTHRQHRQQQYLSLAQRHLALVLDGQLRDPVWEGSELVHLDANSDGSVLTLFIRIPAEEYSEEPDDDERETLAGLLRAELAQHVPRKRTPRLRIVLSR